MAPAPERPTKPEIEALKHLLIHEAQALAANAFLRVGIPEPHAQSAAEILTLAEAMGIPTHGLSRVRVYSKRIAAGGIDPSARITAKALAPALLRVDGQNGLGPAIAERARIEAANAARRCGIGAAFVNGANHLGALAPYLFLAAEAGFAALMTTNTAPMIAPVGARAARIGNNPIGIAIPHPSGHHVLLDMALSVAARSRLRAAAAAGQPVPESWATDADGHPTTDPAEAMRGLMRAVGGDKGAHLALCLDLLAGALSGAGMLDEIQSAAEHPQTPQNLGQMIILIDAALLLPDSERSMRLDRAAGIVASTPALDPAHPARMPGARALGHLRDARVQGLALDPDLLGDLRDLAGV